MKSVARIVGVLALAFVLTSALMYWIPILEHEVGYDVYDYIDTFTTRRGRHSYDTFVQDLQKLSSVEERQTLDEISVQLKQKANAELYQMKAFYDICINGLVDCRGLPSTKVKPFIDAVLSDRQTENTVLNARTSNAIAGGSLFISIIALIFTILTYRWKGTY